MPFSKPRFPCSVCKKKFASEQKLKRHQLTHADDRPYACQVCVATFRNASNLKRHTNEVHASEKKFSCPVCDRKFQALDYVNKHMKCHLRDEPPQDTPRKDRSSLGKENKKLPKRKKSDTDKRNRSTLEQGLKRRKLIDHNGSVELPENEAQSSIVSNEKSPERDDDSGNGSSDTAENGRRNSNTDSKNGNAKPYVCHDCKKCFTVDSSLKRHINDVHAIDKKVLNKKSPARDDDSGHGSSDTIENGRRNSDTDSKPYVCHVCEKCFTVNASLKRHINSVHAIDKKSSCPVYDQKFQAQDSVRVSVESHSANDQHQEAQESIDGEDSSSPESKPKAGKTVLEKFVCTKCDRNFNKPDSLEKHAKSHLPPELFTCDECKESFASKTRLAAHMASHLERDESPQRQRSNRNGLGVIRYQCVRRTSDRGDEFCSDIIAEFECNLCGIVCDSEINFRQHVKKKHEKTGLKETFLCTLCDPTKTFEKEYNLRSHFEIVHEKGERSGYTCVHCSRSFIFKVNLQFHIERCQVDIVN